MHERIRRTLRERADGDRGFTLIEMLVVVVIIGILVAIAIPLYLNYRKGAENKSVESDVRGAISAVEQYYTENNNVYPPGTVAPAVNNPLVFGVAPNQQTATVSPGNQLRYQNIAAAGGVPAHYNICGTNNDSLAIYVYNSANGGSVKKSTSGTLAACSANGV